MIRNVSFASFLVLCFFLAVVAAFHDVLSFMGGGNRERGDNICKVFCAFFLPAFAGMASLFGADSWFCSVRVDQNSKLPFSSSSSSSHGGGLFGSFVLGSSNERLR